MERRYRAVPAPARFGVYGISSEAALVRLPRRCATADVGERSRDDDRVATEVAQDRLEGCVVEGTVGGLMDNDLARSGR
jgi:hypothetical protein